METNPIYVYVDVDDTCAFIGRHADAYRTKLNSI
jgi:hypothetical protein